MEGEPQSLSFIVLARVIPVLLVISPIAMSVIIVLLMREESGEIILHLVESVHLDVGAGSLLRILSLGYSMKKMWYQSVGDASVQASAYSCIVNVIMFVFSLSIPPF